MLRLRMESSFTELRYSGSKARLDLDIDRGTYSWEAGIGGYDMKQGKLQYRQDSTEFRKSLGFYGVVDFARDAAERGKQAVQEAIAGYVDRGIALSKIHKGATIPDAWERYLPYNKNISLEVTSTAEIDWSFEYIPLEMSYNRKNFELKGFTPAGVSYSYTPHSFAIEVAKPAELHISTVDDGL